MSNNRSSVNRMAVRKILLLVLLVSCCSTVAEGAFHAAAAVSTAQRQNHHASVRSSMRNDAPLAFGLPATQRRSKSHELAGSIRELQGGGELSSQTVAAYNLIWSPGFLPRFAVSSAILTFLGMTTSHLRQTGYLVFIPASAPILSAVLSNVILPMLSSSCCLLQLAINLLAGGCAGFNTYLGPSRPYFLALLGYLTVLSARCHPPVITTLRVVLALLPEMVHLWNQQQRRRTPRQAPVRSSANGAPAGIRAKLLLSVPAMGCVSCINKIESSLRHSSPSFGSVVDVRSWLLPSVDEVDDGMETETPVEVEAGNEAHDTGDVEDENDANTPVENGPDEKRVAKTGQRSMEKKKKRGGKVMVEVEAESLDALDTVRQQLVATLYSVGFGDACEIEAMEVGSGR